MWRGPPGAHSPRGLTPPPPMSKEGVVWDRPSLGPSSAKAISPPRSFCYTALPPLHMSEGGRFPAGAWLCVWLTSHPSFSLAGEPLSTRPQKPQPAASALSAFTAISRRPQPGRSGLMHSPPLIPHSLGRGLSKLHPGGGGQGGGQNQGSEGGSRALMDICVGFSPHKGAAQGPHGAMASAQAAATWGGGEGAVF